MVLIGHVDVADTEYSLRSEVDSERQDPTIDLLFHETWHRDTVVRYSAAKGVARISARIPLTFSHDVADSTFELFWAKAEGIPTTKKHCGGFPLSKIFFS